MLANALTKDEVESLWIKSVSEVDFLLNWEKQTVNCYMESDYTSLYKPPSLYVSIQTKWSESDMTLNAEM